MENENLSLDEMLETYRDMKNELAPMLDNMKRLEKQIKAHVKETGETGDVEGIAVTIRNGYERANWDGKALKGYAAAHPEIMEFCKVSTVAPSMAIKIK